MEDRAKADSERPQQRDGSSGQVQPSVAGAGGKREGRGPRRRRHRGVSDLVHPSSIAQRATSAVVSADRSM